jgi:hypothetical protein
MPIFFPRYSRKSFTESPARSFPSYRTDPVTEAFPGSRDGMAWVLTLFPDPLSPTIPRISPLSRLKETPRTARTETFSFPRRTEKLTDKSCTFNKSEGEDSEE